jgi:hypothetical protein
MFRIVGGAVVIGFAVYGFVHWVQQIEWKSGTES